MKLKQTNKGYKCPNCKKFGLEPRHHIISPMPVEECAGHHLMGNNFYRCRNCYATFEEVKE